jgi:hypothetical protein
MFLGVNGIGARTLHGRQTHGGLRYIVALAIDIGSDRSPCEVRSCGLLKELCNTGHRQVGQVRVAQVDTDS